MNLSNPWLIKLKAALFLVIVLIASTLLLVRNTEINLGPIAGRRAVGGLSELLLCLLRLIASIPRFVTVACGH
jgi:hypothetical protein